MNNQIIVSVDSTTGNTTTKALGNWTKGFYGYWSCDGGEIVHFGTDERPSQSKAYVFSVEKDDGELKLYVSDSTGSAKEWKQPFVLISICVERTQFGCQVTRGVVASRIDDDKILVIPFKGDGGKVAALLFTITNMYYNQLNNSVCSKYSDFEDSTRGDFIEA